MRVSAAPEKEVYLPVPGLATSSRLLALRSGLNSLWHEYGALCPECIVFISFTDMTRRATVLMASGSSPELAWADLACQLQTLNIEPGQALHIKLDLVTERYAFTWQRLKEVLAVTKRNYFRFGLALDTTFSRAFLEQELNANAMLYGGAEIEAACLNEGNFRRYFREKYGSDQSLAFDDNSGVELFVTQGFYTANGESLLRISGKGLDSGHRIVECLDVPVLDEMIRSATVYLAEQLDVDGRFQYGWYPCFDREINGYNSLRHASSTYAMVEVYETFPDDALLAKIRASFQYLVKCHVYQKYIDGEDLAYLIDEGHEIKLGGNAVLLLALTKYTEVTGDRSHALLMEKLAAGIASFQCPASGRFRHVLSYPTLMLKDDFRIIYYDGEATFALSSYYRFCRESRWLKIVEHAFDWFELKRYGKYHDHWIAYACDVMYELTGERRYYDMAISNIAGYLDFIAQRITAFPTLLELMVATERLFDRHHREQSCTYEAVGEKEFRQAMELRAKKMLDGYFWPELAMYYKVPNKIQGTFFIRHHSFRVRIDDVEHFLSALVGYRKYLLKRREFL